MRAVLSRARHAAAIGIVVVMGLAALAGLGACGGQETTTTAGAYNEEAGYGSMSAPTTVAYTETTAAPSGSNGAQPNVAKLTGESGQKIIGDAVIDIEVVSGGFQTAFTNAALLSDRYGGYMVASQSSASGEDGRIDAGTVAVRVPAASFSAAIADAGRLGTLKNQQITTQDVTEEYVDLQARIINSQAKLDTFRKLFDKATTIDDIVSVQQVVTAAQDELEQLKGRQRFLQEHTSYSTLTINIREAGAEVVAPVVEDSWGVGEAFSDAARNFVKALNAIVRALGIVIPVLVVLAIIAYIVFRVWRWNARKKGRMMVPPPAGPGGASNQP
jgi:hypothetical protein